MKTNTPELMQEARAAFARGAGAARTGASLDDNPESTARNADAWERGWYSVMG